MANLAALRIAVFSLSAKNLRGVDIRPPAVHGLNADLNIYVKITESDSYCIAIWSWCVNIGALINPRPYRGGGGELVQPP